MVITEEQQIVASSVCPDSEFKEFFCSFVFSFPVYKDGRIGKYEKECCFQSMWC
jgi:hypothetical protein